KLRSMPGVSSAGVTTDSPFAGFRISTMFSMADRPSLTSQYDQADIHTVDPGYLAAMQIPVLQGRNFSVENTHESPKVALINQTAAHRYWNERNPIDASITFDGNVKYRIIGIVRNIKGLGLNEDSVPEIYVNYIQSPVPAMTFAVRGNPPISSL